MIMTEEQFLTELEPLKDRLYNFARRHLFRQDDADDVFSEAVLSAWAQRDRYRLGTNFKVWIYRILLNKVYTANRRRMLDAKLDPAPVAAENENGREIEARAMEGDLEPLLQTCGDELRRAVNALNESERETFLLLSLADMSYAEIAAVTNAPEATVLTRLARARRKLREQLLRLGAKNVHGGRDS